MIQPEAVPVMGKPPYCKAQGGSRNWICTREAGHTGEHAAHQMGGSFLESWPREKVVEDAKADPEYPPDYQCEARTLRAGGSRCGRHKGHPGEHLCTWNNGLSYITWPDSASCVEEVPTKGGRKMFRFLFKSAFVLAALTSFTSHTSLWEPAKAKGWEAAANAVRWWRKGPTDDFGFLAKEVLSQLKDEDAWGLTGDHAIGRGLLFVQDLHYPQATVEYRKDRLPLTEDERAYVGRVARKIFEAKEVEREQRLAREIATELDVSLVKEDWIPSPDPPRQVVPGTNRGITRNPRVKPLSDLEKD